MFALIRSFADVMCRILRHIRLMPLVLVQALILAAMIPQGMMFVAAPDGQRLVICSEDGPREMVLTADGEVVDLPVGGHDAQTTDCPAITLDLTDVQDGKALPAWTVFFEPFRPVLRAGVLSPAAPPQPFAPRAPPFLI